MTPQSRLLNAGFLTGLFDGMPPLVNVELRKLTVDRDGPTVTLDIALSTFPVCNVPRHWSERNANTVVVRLVALAVEAIQFDGIGTTMKCDIELAEEPERVTLTVRGDARGTIRASWLRIDEVSAYEKQSEER